MKRHWIHRSILPLLVLSGIQQASAVVIFNSDFTSVPNPDFSFTAAGSGGTAGYASDGPGGSTAIKLHDPAATGTSSTAVLTPSSTPAIPAFDTSLAGQEYLHFRADFAVMGFSVASNNTNYPRMIIRNLADTTQSITVGLGHTSSGNVALVAVRGEGGSANPSSDAIRFVINSYGAYNASDATANDTNDQYVTIDLFYRIGSTSLDVYASGGGIPTISGQVNGFSGTSAFSNSSLQLTMATGSTSIGTTVYIDNLLLETTSVPEPAAAALASLGALALFKRRRG